MRLAVLGEGAQHRYIHSPSARSAPFEDHSRCASAPFPPSALPLRTSGQLSVPSPAATPSVAFWWNLYLLAVRLRGVNGGQKPETDAWAQRQGKMKVSGRGEMRSVH